VPAGCVQRGRSSPLTPTHACRNDTEERGSKALATASGAEPAVCRTDASGHGTWCGGPSGSGDGYAGPALGRASVYGLQQLGERRVADLRRQLARTSGARLVVIGTKLMSMSRHTAQWRELVARVRAPFPGRVTFAANQLAGASKIAFWDALDYVGIDAYMPLAANNPNPTVDELVRAWTEFRDETGVRHHYLDQIGALQRRTRKPVLFTELGYRSGLGTAARPWDWDSSLVAAQEPQARAYEAAFRVSGHENHPRRAAVRF
jgi:hypothetical protein